MGKGYRQGRLGEEIRRIISEMLLRDIKDPRLQDAMVSLSAVEVTSDGSYATCYVTILSVSRNEEEKKEKEEQKATPTPSEAAKEEAAGIAFWGDDLLTESNTQQYSYMAVFQKILQENGYTIPVFNKTLQGGGTLSMMKRAGVEDEVLQGYIAAHQQAANGAQLPVTETGIRDFSQEELIRDDADCIPIIFMGYYGGWNHDPNELAAQQEHILKTFSDQEKFIVVGTRPLDGSVDSASLDAVLSQKWGEHYISLAAVTANPASTYEAQEAMAQAIYEKMTELKYISK